MRVRRIVRHRGDRSNVEDVARRLHDRALRWLRRHGYVEDRAAESAATRQARGGAVELAQALASSETVTSCVLRQWLRFALGRDDGELDAESIDRASERARQESGDLRELIVGLTVSDAFRHRRVPKSD